MALLNYIKHDMVCKSVTEINGHAKNFPNISQSEAKFMH